MTPIPPPSFNPNPISPQEGKSYSTPPPSQEIIEFMNSYSQAIQQIESIATITNTTPPQITFTQQTIEDIVNSSKTAEPNSAYWKLYTAANSFLSVYIAYPDLCPKYFPNLCNTLESATGAMSYQANNSRPTQSVITQSITQIENALNGTSSPYSGLLGYPTVFNSYTNLSNNIVSPFGSPLWNWSGINQNYTPLIHDLGILISYATSEGNNSLATLLSDATSLFNNLSNPKYSHDIPNIQVQLNNLLPGILSGCQSLLNLN